MTSESAPETVTAEDQKVENSEASRDQQEKRLAELVAKGRRALKLNDTETATDVLSDAAELSSELYGENHEKTFEPVMYYGMATLEFAKAESQLLKNQQENEDNEEEKADGGTEDEESKKDHQPKEDNDDSDKEDGEESDGETDDNDSMRLAWEVLEAARCIADAKIEQLEAERSGVSAIESWKLKLADVLVLLGDHGLADGKYVQAQEDLTRALEIQSSILAPSSRVIAHTYMLIGNACAQDARYDETVDFYEKTKKVLVARQEELQTQLKGTSDKEVMTEAQSELNDLKEMTTEMDTMIADAKCSAAQTEEVKKSIKEQYQDLTAAFLKLPNSEDTVEANDISNLVRRPTKRPTESTSEVSNEKKTKEGNQ